MTLNLPGVVATIVTFAFILQMSPAVSSMLEGLGAGPFVQLLASLVVPFLLTSVVIAATMEGVRSE